MPLTLTSAAIAALLVVACVADQYDAVRAIQNKIAQVDREVVKQFDAVNAAHGVTAQSIAAGVATPNHVLKEYGVIETAAAKKKQELYEERNEVASKIPGFWQLIMKHHPTTHSWCTDTDKEILKSLTHVHLTQVGGFETNNAVTVTMTFAPNDYFSDTTLSRSDFLFHENEFDPNKGTPSGINWKEGKKPAKRSFFDFFQKHSDEALYAHEYQDILNVFANDFQRDPTPFIEVPQMDYEAHYKRIMEESEGMANERKAPHDDMVDEVSDE